MSKLIFGIILLWSFSSEAAINCTEKYRIVRPIDIRVCSHQPLERSDLEFIKSVTELTTHEYLVFIESKGILPVNVDKIDRVDVAIMSSKALNDGTLPMGKTAYGEVLGRYYPGYSKVYVDISSIKLRQTVLAHEIAHLMNDRLGISDKVLDEELAYEFEEYLVSR